MTKDCQLLSLSCGLDVFARKGRAASLQSTTRDVRAQAPVLKSGAATADAQQSVKRRKIGIGISRGSDNVRNTSVFEFPALSGKFTSAFIAKSLGKSS